MKRTLFTENAPAAIGPYSQAIETETMVYCSGQLGVDPAIGKMVTGGVAAEAEQAMKNVVAVLTNAGLTLDNVVKTTVYITKMADFAEMNGVYGSYFTTDCPARSCVAVAELPLGGLVEIEVLCVK